MEQAFARKSIVVTGVVLGLHPAVASRDQFRDSANPDLPRWYPVTKIEIGVTGVYKGDPPEKIVLTHIGCCVCEEELAAGKEYLLFVQPSWNLPKALMVSFCDPNKQMGRNRSALSTLGRPRRVLPVNRFRSTLRERFRYGVDRAQNVAARIYLSRLDPRPFVTDPLVSIAESPWFPFTRTLALGAVLGAVVVVLRRRTRRSGGA